MIDRFDLIVDRCKEVAIKAKSLYGTPFDKLYVGFVDLGLSSGVCWYSMGSDSEFNVEFNRKNILGNGFEWIINDTVPHEIAHLVCEYNPILGYNHDSKWKNICKELGGSGQTYDISKSTIYYKHGTFRYTSILGNRCDLSVIRHNRIQRGGAYEFRGGDEINNSCEFEEL